MSKDNINPFARQDSNGSPFSRQDSNGLDWADQWDYKLNDTNHNDTVARQNPTKKEKMADMNRKAKAAATTGFAKAKVGATVAATKMSAGVSWIKQQVDKRRAPK